MLYIQNFSKSNVHHEGPLLLQYQLVDELTKYMYDSQFVNCLSLAMSG